MSFESSLVLKNRLDANVTYVKLSDDSSKSLFTRADLPVGTPSNFQIAHTMGNPGSKGNDKHLVKLTRTRVGAAGNVIVDTINLTSSVAREGYTAADWYDLYAALTSFLTEVNIDKMHRGEV